MLTPWTDPMPEKSPKYLSRNDMTTNAEAGDPGARERIVLATVAVIERDGLAALRIRAVAEQAGVNVAAVNYYFGSKAALIAETLRSTADRQLGEALDELRADLAAASGDLENGLRRFLTRFTADAVRYPRFTEAHLHGALTQQDYSSPSVRRLQEFLEGFADILAGHVPQDGVTPARVRRAVAHLWTGILHLGLLPHLHTPLTSLDPLAASARDLWIEDWIRHFRADLAGD